jgi:Protein of unknown function (DUF2380)
LIDTSLEGAIRGARPDEQERLARLKRSIAAATQRLGRFSLVDITPIAREAQASNLQAGCDMPPGGLSRPLAAIYDVP